MNIHPICNKTSLELRFCQKSVRTFKNIPYLLFSHVVIFLNCIIGYREYTLDRKKIGTNC